MAIPIATTPILSGEEARKFQRNADKNRNKFATKKEVNKAVALIFRLLGIVK